MSSTASSSRSGPAATGRNASSHTSSSKSDHPHSFTGQLVPPSEVSHYSGSSTTELWTPSSSEDEIVDLSPEPREILGHSDTRRTSASTARSLLSDLHLRGSVERTRENSLTDREERAQSLGLSPSGTISTYADLHNATPTPRPRPSVDQPLNSSLQRLLQWSPSPSVATRLQNLELEGNEAESDGEVSPAVSEGEEEGGEMDHDSDHERESNPLYDVRQERLPRARIYNNRLQNALRDVKNQFTKLKNTMRNSPLAQDESSDFYALYEQVKNFSRFEYPETRTVGFIGDSGVGKSSLINSLLDQEGLARSSGDGAACTCVVTEFRNVDQNHQHPFTIEVDYMNENEVKELLEELLRSFRQYYTDAYREVTDVEEQQQIRETSTRAWETLHSLFRNQPGLTHEYLSDEADGAEAAILRHLEEWAKAGFIHRPGGADALQYSVTANDLDECRDLLDALTTDPPNEDRPAIWPFIKLIRVYLRSPILRTGLILADLPGFRDLNFARVRATERYLRHSCDEVFIVTKISRCVTDQSIPDIIRRCDADQLLRIVCTRSEDVNPDETARSSPPNVKEHIKQLRRGIQNLNRDIAATRSRRHRATEAEDMRLAVKESRLRDEKENSELELLRFLIERRNEQVTESLREKYTDADRVFCVSNRLYSEHREDGRERAEAYIGLSGVRELRRYCQSVPAEAQFRATEAFLKHRAPTLLRSLNQWALAGSDQVTAERAATLRQVLTECEEMFRQRLTSRHSDISRVQRGLEEQFATSITNIIHNRQDYWRDGAVAISREWAGWHHTSYAAFCRKYGTWTTKAVGSRCWNDEILEEAREELQGRWESVVDWVESQEAEFEEATADLFQSIRDLLEEHVNLAPQALENLLTNMELREHCILDIVHDSLEALIDNTTEIQKDALRGHDSSYIADLMHNTYAACNRQSGNGSHRRRTSIMHEHLMYSRLFTNLSRTIETEHNTMVRATFQALKQNIQQEVDNIARDLRAVVAAEGEVTEAGQSPALARTLRKKINKINRVLDKAKRIVEEVRNSEE
ncbi:hypothetical protein VTN77DRAFT_3003 [Rasamsonia byssochlamydoides]|uniref:uncharacterized protein n=1 Tax=Rasamsonia byssochlamydoides TaxID=89139 RepID=UPI003742689C